MSAAYSAALGSLLLLILVFLVALQRLYPGKRAFTTVSGRGFSTRPMFLGRCKFSHCQCHREVAFRGSNAVGLYCGSRAGEGNRRGDHYRDFGGRGCVYCPLHRTPTKHPGLTGIRVATTASNFSTFHESACGPRRHVVLGVLGPIDMVRHDLGSAANTINPRITNTGRNRPMLA